MEEWDILNADRSKTGRISIRGEYLKPGDYHLVVLILMVNANNEILISQRSKEKNGAFLWEVCGGAVIAGENSRQGALREMKEELGIEVDYNCNNGKIVAQDTFEEPHGWLADIWIFNIDEDIENLEFQKEEVINARWSTKEEVISMINKGEFFKGNVFVEHVFDKGLL